VWAVESFDHSRSESWYTLIQLPHPEHWSSPLPKLPKTVWSVPLAANSSTKSPPFDNVHLAQTLTLIGAARASVTDPW
jgi:hypothetical protein